jgi:hypothetical protein
MTPPDTLRPKRVEQTETFLGPNSVFVRFDGAEPIELSLAAAIALYDQLDPIGRRKQTKIIWTEARKEKLRRMYADESIPLAEIAKAFDTNVGNIRVNLVRFNFPPRNKNSARALRLLVSARREQLK